MSSFRFLRIAGDESDAAGHSWTCVGHLLVGLKRTDTVAGRALADVDPRLGPATTKRRGGGVTPAVASVLGFADGFAAGRDVTEEDVLVAVLWEWPYPIRQQREQVAQRLREEGV